MVAEKYNLLTMPNRPKAFCNNSHCPNVADKGKRFCNKCKKENAKEKESPHELGYDRQWATVSKMVRRNEPICRMCKTKLAKHVDHIVPLKEGGERLALSNLQPLCIECHNLKTQNDKHIYNFH
jgi:hypothetical protein